MYEEPSENTEDSASSGLNPAAIMSASLTGYAAVISFIIDFIKALCNFWTIHLEMVLQPRFSSEYFNPIAVAGSLIAVNIWTATAALLGVFSQGLPGYLRPHDAPIGMLTLYLSYVACIIYHAIRVKHLMQHMELELDSEEDGPPLPIFGFLPKSYDWMRVRVWYQPIFVIVLAITLWAIHILHLFAAVYLVFCALLLFFKATLLSYEGWRFERSALNKRNRAKRIRGIFTGKESPQTFAGRVLATVPDNPQARAFAAAAMTGMREEYAHLVSDPEPPESGPAAAPRPTDGKPNGSSPLYATYADESGVNGHG